MLIEFLFGVPWPTEEKSTKGESIINTTSTKDVNQLVVGRGPRGADLDEGCFHGVRPWRMDHRVQQEEAEKFQGLTTTESG